MNNVLIIALSEKIKVECIDEFIQFKMTESPHLNFSILTNDAYTSKLHYTNYILDHKNIKKLAKSKIFNTGYALNLLFDELYEVSKKNWDCIYNFSDDNLSLYISSFIANKNNTKISGISLNGNSKCYSTIWSSLLDSQINSKVKYYFNYSNVLINLSKDKPPGEREIDKQYQVLFSKIKNKTREDQKNKVNITGVFINETTLQNDEEWDNLYQTVEDLLYNPNYYPVLIYPSIICKNFIKIKLEHSFFKYLIKISYTPKSIDYINLNLDIIINKTSDPFPYYLDSNILLIDSNEHKDINTFIASGSSQENVCTSKDIEKSKVILSIFDSAFNNFKLINIYQPHNPLLQEWASVQTQGIKVKQQELKQFKAATNPEEKSHALQNLLISDNSEMQDIIIFIFNAKINQASNQHININNIINNLLELTREINYSLRSLSEKTTPPSIIKKGEYEQRT